MFSIKGNVIRITKGDSAAFEVDLKNEDGTPYEMQTGDKLTLTVRKKVGSPVLMKVTSSSNIIDFIPEKTSNLKVGACVYDIQLETASNDVFTVVGLEDMSTANMIVLPEVTV